MNYNPSNLANLLNKNRLVINLKREFNVLLIWCVEKFSKHEIQTSGKRRGCRKDEYHIELNFYSTQNYNYNYTERYHRSQSFRSVKSFRVQASSNPLV